MKKRLLSALLALCMVLALLPGTAFATSGHHPFTDVSDTAWYSSAVQYVYEHGMMTGTNSTGTTFSPNSPTSRGMIITILHRLEGTPSASGMTFEDVPTGQWYTNAVAWASANNIMGGYGNGKFGPNDPITREQMATTLYRYAQYKEYNTTITGDVSVFSDGGKVSSYAVDAVNWAIGVGLFTGTDNNMFAPTDGALRSQAATVLMRFCENIVPSSENVAQYHTVTFEYNYSGGGTYRTVTVEHGKTVTSPTSPTRSGYTFSGWYTAASGGSKFDFSTAITSDLTLYAHWTSASGGSGASGGSPSVNYYTVTFDLNYTGGGVYQTQQVAYGGTVTNPGYPSRTGYYFTGWYADSSAKLEVFDFTTPVTSNIVLYAGWEQIVDNLEDDKIDRGDIEAMLTEGDIDVIFDENGNIRTIDGSFTDKEVNSKQDAADVLNSAASLFTDNWYFGATAAEITSQSASDANGNDEEYFYRYSPTVNGIPVLGSQIIISTNSEGDVSGLYSTYNSQLSYVDTTATISSKNAIDAAIDALIASEGVQAAISEYLSNDEGNLKTVDELEQELADELSDTTPQLMVYAVDDSETPSLVYEVILSDIDFNNGPTYEADGSTEPANSIDSPTELGEPDNESDVENSGSMLSINSTYYVYANGESAGQICSVISNDLDWTSYYLSSPDLSGNRRTYIGQEENGTYRLYDSVRNIETHKAAETTTGHLWWAETTYSLPGDIVTSSFNTFGLSFMDKSAVSAHANMEKVYDYYLNTLGRNSYDGYGKKIVTTVGYYAENGRDYINASWRSQLQQFVFGKGKCEAAVDIMGHEFTHAVINYVVGNGYDSGLIYYRESGALNESYADIMGALIEGKSGTDKWLVGEDRGSVSRSMADPSLHNQPEHYSALSSPYWSAQLDRYVGRDNEGVHIFSGIFNFAAYKMMTDSRTSGISDATWANVFYRSMFRLTSNATFLDARGAIIATAKTYGFTAEQQQAIKDAFDAVGITEPDSIRIVLTWGATPSDLDSHLVGPGINGGERFHIAFYQRTYYADGSYYSSSSKYVADLDYDDVTSYGPEVTTIHILTPGEYYFFVHDFSNGSSETSTEMAYSGATVRVYEGSSGTPISTFNVDPSSSGTYWNVFKLTIGANGSFTIEAINTYGATETLS